MRPRSTLAVLAVAIAVGLPTPSARGEDATNTAPVEESATDAFDRLGKAVRASQRDVYAAHKKAAEKEQADAKAEGRDPVNPTFDRRAIRTSDTESGHFRQRS